MKPFANLHSRWLGVVMWAALSGSVVAAEPVSRLRLTDGWAIQSSAQVQATGEAVSAPGFGTSGWVAARVPSTVVGTLVEAGVYGEPFVGTNMSRLPGMGYPVGANFSNVPMPADSPFRGSWWYRTEFRVTPPAGGRVWLNFEGVNYRADVWVNGKRIADREEVAGAYRTYRFDITDEVRPKGPNALAVEVFAPEVDDLGITWVDWNPAPPDKNMGLWRDVSVTTTGPVAMRDPQVLTKVDMPGLDRAHVTWIVPVFNAGGQAVTATVQGRAEGIRVRQEVKLGPGESREVVFAPERFPQLHLNRPRLWWPTQMGEQPLYNLDLEVRVDGRMSDRQSVRFGIREVTSELSDRGYRVFKINGRPVLIRGGGWAPDVFLRSSPEREAAEIRYVKAMHLNTIRFEGKTESRRFLERCDQEGIMVIAGWCCCDHWEKWDRWKEDDYRIAAESLRDQLRRLRNHPSVITWWYGSDNPPNARAEANYLAVLKEQRWPNPAQSSATAKPSPAGQPTGLRMTGPYEYVPPVYWYVDTNAGGAYCFNTETSPGPAVPPIESLRRMLPPEHLWPIDDVWAYHAGGGPFHSLAVFTEALNRRLGEATGVEDYARKAQLMAYDGERAMFEAYGRNKYVSTGVIQWMMNNAWPSMIWHLYDYYLRPGGGYYGTRKACEPLHIQYSYDDRSVVVVNSQQRSFPGLRATARLLNLDLTDKWSQGAALDIGPDGVRRVMVVPEPAGLTPAYFLQLSLADAAGRPVSSNFYWLSTRPETLDVSRGNWYYTPTKDYADLRALGTLPPAEVRVSARSQRAGGETVTRVMVENPAKSLAFFVHLKISRGAGGDEILPVLWEDNYFPLMPGERREIRATYAIEPHGAVPAVVEVDGWNVAPRTAPVGR